MALSWRAPPNAITQLQSTNVPTCKRTSINSSRVSSGVREQLAREGGTLAAERAAVEADARKAAVEARRC